MWGRLVRTIIAEPDLNAPEVLPLTEKENYFGRLSTPPPSTGGTSEKKFTHSSQGVIPCAFVSSTHFSIVYKENEESQKRQYFISDYSRNGTCLNSSLIGKRIEELKDKDEVSLTYKNKIKVAYRFELISQENQVNSPILHEKLVKKKSILTPAGSTDKNKEILSRQMAVLHQESKKLEERISELHEKNEFLCREIASVEKRSRASEEIIKTQKSEITELQEKNLLFSSEKETAEKKLQPLEATIKTQNNQISELKEQNSNLESNSIVLETHNRKLSEQLEESQLKIKELNSKNASLQDDLKYKNEQLESRRLLIDEGNSILSEYKTMKKHSEEEIASLRTRVKTIQESKNEILTKNKELIGTIGTLHKTIETLQDFNSENKDLIEKLMKAEQENKEKDQQLRNLWTKTWESLNNFQNLNSLNNNNNMEIQKITENLFTQNEKINTTIKQNKINPSEISENLNVDAETESEKSEKKEKTVLWDLSKGQTQSSQLNQFMSYAAESDLTFPEEMRNPEKTQNEENKKIADLGYTQGAGDFEFPSQFSTSTSQKIEKNEIIDNSSKIDNSGNDEMEIDNDQDKSEIGKSQDSEFYNTQMVKAKIDSLLEEEFTEPEKTNQTQNPNPKEPTGETSTGEYKSQESPMSSDGKDFTPKVSTPGEIKHENLEEKPEESSKPKSPTHKETSNNHKDHSPNHKETSNDHKDHSPQSIEPSNDLEDHSSKEKEHPTKLEEPSSHEAHSSAHIEPSPGRSALDSSPEPSPVKHLEVESKLNTHVEDEFNKKRGREGSEVVDLSNGNNSDDEITPTPARKDAAVTLLSIGEKNDFMENNKTGEGGKKREREEGSEGNLEKKSRVNGESDKGLKENQEEEIIYFSY